jgi:hypothetical protein
MFDLVEFEYHILTRKWVLWFWKCLKSVWVLKVYLVIEVLGKCFIYIAVL